MGWLQSQANSHDFCFCPSQRNDEQTVSLPRKMAESTEMIGKISGRAKRSAGKDGGVSATQRKAKRPKPSQSRPTLEHQPKSIIIARMAMDALSNVWSMGENREIGWDHVRTLSKRFSDKHGPDRENPKHYMKILADGEDILRMVESIHHGEAEDGGHIMLHDFSKWMLINDGRQAEIASGQHRKEALRMYVENGGLGEEELWWPCEIYDRGEFNLRHCNFPLGIVTVRQTKSKKKKKHRNTDN
jgi:hypothetical protein